MFLDISEKDDYHAFGIVISLVKGRLHNINGCVLT